VPAGPVTAVVHPVQVINVPAGWSGLSSCINPINPDIETIFQPVVDQLVILQSETGMYWPGENINNLFNWDSHTGYKIKVNESVSLMMNGPYEPDKTIQLSEGWNVIPVLSECAAEVADIFAGLDVVLVKEIAGNNLYWPAYAISTLEFLQSGKAYFVLMAGAGEIVFPECMAPSDSPLRGRASQHSDRINEKVESRCSGTSLLLREKGPGDEVKGQSAGTPLSSRREAGGEVKTPITHTIAIPWDAVDYGMGGSLLGAFNQNGDCFGWTKLTGENNAIALFGDDPTTPEIDGFIEGELITFKLWDKAEMQFRELEATFDSGLPQNEGLFFPDGISAIINLKAGITGINNFSVEEIRVYPNPANDFINIDIDNQALLNGMIEVCDLQGKRLFNGFVHPGNNCFGVSSLEPGIYLLKIYVNEMSRTTRLIIQ
jgi:hypothetical protein